MVFIDNQIQMISSLLNSHTMMSFSILLAIFFSFFLPLSIKLMKKKDEHKKLPPGPNKLPIIGNLHQLSQPMHQTLRRLSNKHGPLMFLQLGSVPTLVVSSAAMANQVLKTHDLIFASRPSLYATRKVSYNGTNIIFAPYGNYWRQVRKIAVLELLSVKRVQSFEFIREEEVGHIIQTIADSSSNSTPINLTKLLFMLVNNVIHRAVFSKQGKEKGKSGTGGEYGEIIDETLELLSVANIADTFPWLGWFNKLNRVEASLEKNFKTMDSFYDTVIQEHRARVKSKGDEFEDLVDVLLRVQNDPNQEIRLTNDNIKGIITDMFVAGTDGSAVTLVWTMTELIKCPSAMRKAQEEVRGVVKEKGVQVKESHLPKLAYLKMIVKEVLRLHPPAPLLLPRETIERCSIEGYEIPAKTRVLINAASIAMDPEYWENPEEFKPERFLDTCIDFRGQHFELLPFGAGRRGCPGMNFGLLVVELAVANLLHSFDWTLPDGVRAEDIDMEESFGIVVHKKTHLYLVASKP